MGKKLKGGRRQILQLEKRHPKADSESYPSGIEQNNDAAPLESQIADFFKEIDALSVPEELSIEPDKATSSKNIPKADSLETAADMPALTSKDDNLSDVPCKAGISCPWQEICDSSSGYIYYWNMQTNEVTWDCPPEYANYIRSVNTSTIEASYAAQNDKYNDEKEKKKKNIDVEVTEGAIIPISYFGNSSSSDNSSDFENELPNKKKSEKFSELKKNKIVKNIESNERENSEPIGPCLPPDFKFPTANSDIIERSSQMTVSQNEIQDDDDDDVVLIYSSLPPKCLYNIKEKPSQSDLDSACSSENEKAGGQSPDSTVKKIKSSPNQNAYEGFHPVVEYDSFTDEDEEICIANISSETNRYKKDCVEKRLFSNRLEQENMTENSNTQKMLVIAQNKISSFKRKSSEALKRDIEKEELIKKPKIRDVNIDNLFASHSAFSKYGFGWKNQFDEQNDELCTSTPYYKTKKNQSEFKTVSFIKSKNILDLKALNDENICDEKNVLQNVSIPTNTNYIKSNASEQYIKPILNNKLVMNGPTEEIVEILSDSDTDSSILPNKKDIIDCTISKKKKKEKTNFHCISTSLQVDDDLDEIDKALCEALDAKMSAKNLSLKSLPPVSNVTNTPENMIQSTSTEFVKKQKEVNEFRHNALDADVTTDDILKTATDLIDKVRFFLSSPSTNAAFTGAFFQMQTRFVDWHSRALSNNYFMSRLKELEQYIHNYETSVISGEWTYQWHRENKRYFFFNARTQHAQWTYPVEIFHQCRPWSQPVAGPSSAQQHYFETVPPSVMCNNSAQNYPVSSLTLQSKDISSGTTGILQSSLPVFDSPPPLPHTPPSSSPPPPPPDRTEILKEPIDMDIENSNDSSSFIFVNNKNLTDDRQIQLLSMIKQSSKESPESLADTSIISAVSSTSLPGCEDLSTASQLSHPISHTFDSSKVNNMQWSQPSCSSEVKINYNSTGSASINTDFPPNLIDKFKSTNPVSKKEKKKAKIQPGLGLKKKSISSLVEKWQKIKEQQYNEDDDSDDCESGNSF